MASTSTTTETTTILFQHTASNHSVKGNRVSFDSSKTLEDALTTSTGNKGTIYFTTDDYIVLNGEVYGDNNRVPVVTMTTSSAELEPNIFYVWEEMPTLDITLATPTNTNIYNEYMFQFTSGSIATTLSIPSTITWYAGNNSISANKTYQISIVNNLAILGEF